MGLYPSPVTIQRQGHSYGKVTTNALGQVAVRGTYNEQTSNARRSLASSSALDAAAGSGARTVRITYYADMGGIYGPYTETVTLNGTTPVDTFATDICYIEKMEMLTGGSSSASNAGVITLYVGASGTGGVLATIAATERASRFAHHYVASGVTCYVSCVCLSSTAAAANNPTFLCTYRDPRQTTNVPKILLHDLDVKGSDPIVDLSFGPPYEVYGPAVILFLVSPTNTAIQTHKTEFSYYEVP